MCLSEAEHPELMISLCAVIWELVDGLKKSLVYIT